MKAIFKYNGGLGALLCSSCRVIMKTGKDFTDDEWKSIRGELDMPPQYCSNCKTKQSIKHEGHKTTKQDMPQVQDGEDQGRIQQVERPAGQDGRLL